MDVKPLENAIISAETLKNSDIQKRELYSISMGLVEQISNSIKDSHACGKHFIVANLPITFNILNMSNTDSQRTVWYSIGRAYESKGYTVRYEITSRYCKIHIKWLSADEESNIMYQNRYLADRIKK